MAELTNNDVLEIIEKQGITEAVNYIVSQKYLSLKPQSVKSSLIRLTKKYRQIKKLKNSEKKNEQLSNFKNEKYQTPKPGECSRKSPSEDYYMADMAPESSYSDSLQGYRQTALDLSQEVAHLQHTCTVNPKLKNFQRTKQMLKQTKAKLLTLTKTNAHLPKVNNIKNAELKRTRLSVAYLRKQNRKLKKEKESFNTEAMALQVEIDRLQKHANDLNATIGQLEAENDWLREMVDENVQTFNVEKNFYTTEVQECVYSLLQNNVTSSKVSPVIESVLKLAKRKATRLPSRTTVNTMNVQRLMISHRQIEEEFSQKRNTCLLSDETSKFGKKYQGFHAADEEGNTWCLGIREMATKGSETVLSTFKEILSDIDDISGNGNKRSEEIMVNIASTMSDRAATQVKFNELLEEFRTDIVIGRIGEAWESFNDIQKSQLTKLCNFFCSLHVLVHLAEAASAALLQYEKTVFDTNPPIHDKSFQKASEPGATRLIRTACKAFAAGGDEKSGMHGNFSTYTRDFLKQHKLRSVPLERFRGNRFNILFSSAASVHFLVEQMKGYLEISADNRLLQAVKADLNTEEYLAGCKALGLVSELITIPLWAQIERTDTNIIDIGAVYREVVNYLEKLDTHNFMKGNAVMSFVDQNKLWSSVYMKNLVTEYPYDDKVEVVLQIMLPALYSVTKRLFKDHLEGEIWANPAEEILDKTVATPNHNKFSETVFGVLDRILREKPNISLIAAESYILFCHNKTLRWLESKTDKEKRELLSNARNNVKKMRKKFVERKNEIEEQRRARLNAARQKSEAIQKQRMKRKEVMTNDILIWGLWQSEQEVDSAIERLTTMKDKRVALSAQLRFRRNVLQQKVKLKDNTVYALSRTVNGKSVMLPIEEMIQHVKGLVRDAFINERQLSNTDSTVPLIVGQNIRHCQLVNEERVWFNGKIISQVSFK